MTVEIGSNANLHSNLSNRLILQKSYTTGITRSLLLTSKNKFYLNIFDLNMQSIKWKHIAQEFL